MIAVGVGLRTPHYDTWLRGADGAPPVVEAITENVLDRGGRPRALVDRVRESSNLILHGVSMSIGSVDPLDAAYLDSLAELVRRLEPLVVSDHLSFGRVGGVSGHDLWPLMMTEEALEHVVRRVDQVQERLGRRIALENVSSYLRGRHDTMPECEFVRAVALRSGCQLLVDVNNIAVSAHNHAFSAEDSLDRMPASHVAYLHVAGHSDRDGYKFDDHGSLPNDEVRALLARGFERFGDVPCIFEWDEDYPDLDGYLRAARQIGDEARAAILSAQKRAG